MILALISSSAYAGDIASVRPVGFSPDGAIFAFEEYGILDGSGFPYANIYALDLEKDAFLPGTPFRARLQQDGATVAQARWQAQNAAEGLIETHEIASHPAEFLALNPVTEAESDPRKIRYRHTAAWPPVGEPSTLVLEEIPQSPDPSCEGLIERKVSFRLRFTERNGKLANEVVHDDEHIPQSRRCVSGYRLGGVVAGEASGGGTVEVALVMVLSAGFEGFDGRWIAVPIKAASRSRP
jgi:predicted secreted protein